jgi:SRSO17 transposase
MDQRGAKGVASRFSEYIEHLSEVIGHADRHGPLACILHRPIAAGCPQERRANGCAYRA